VKSLMALDYLGVGGEQLAVDLGPLTGLPLLRAVELADGGTADYGPLTTLPALRYLGLAGAKVDQADLAELGKLVGLTNLDLSDTAVADITPLAPLVGLLTINCRNTAVASLAPALAWTEVEKLLFAGTKVADITGVDALQRLAELDLADSAVDDLAAIAANDYFRRGDRVDVTGAPVDLGDCPAILDLRNRDAVVLTDVTCD
jgi:Leucine-rich repeat (LRR) protein